jgi:hypothetical protein
MREEKKLQILYFIKGPVPSPDDLAAAKALGTKCFRNANHSSTPPREGCRAAGAVPENYRKSKSVEVVQTSAPQQPKQQDRK